MLILIGGLSSAYFTPLIDHWLGDLSEPVENGLAFLIGLTSLGLIGGIIKISQIFQIYPLKFMKRIFGIEISDKEINELNTNKPKNNNHDDTTNGINNAP